MNGANSKSSLPPFTERSPRYMASAQSTTPVTVTGDGQHSTPPPSFSTPTQWVGIGTLLRKPVDPMNVLLTVACLTMAYSLVWGF